MASPSKKRDKLQARIDALETELKTSLQKKSAGPAIDVSAYTSRIRELKKELAGLK
jgi:hypothetical protein